MSITYSDFEVNDKATTVLLYRDDIHIGDASRAHDAMEWEVNYDLIKSLCGKEYADHSGITGLNLDEVVFELSQW